MTRVDLTGPRATCIHVTSCTRDKYVGSQCDNSRRFVDTTPSLILDLLKCFWMNHRSYWCHHGLVSRILDSITSSDGLCRKGHYLFIFLWRTVILYNKLSTKKIICIHISFSKVECWFLSCRNVKWFFLFCIFWSWESSITRIRKEIKHSTSREASSRCNPKSVFFQE